MKRNVSTVVAIIVILCLVNGCATTGHGLRARYDNPNDPCKAQREPLLGSRDHFKKSMITGAAVGAAAGAAAGAALVKENRLLGALIGGVVGGLAGLSIGYLGAKKKEAKNKAELRQAIDQDISNDTEKVGQLGHALRALNQCRAEQVVSIRQGLKSGGLSHEAARMQIASVRAAVQSDNALVQAILKDVTQRNAVYVSSIAEVEEISKEQKEQYKNKVYSYEPTLVSNTPDHQPSTPQPGKTTIVNTHANMRDAPDMQANIIKKLRKGQSVEVYELEKGSWYRVKAGDTEGYVFRNLLGEQTAVVSPQSKPIQRRDLPVVDRKARPQASNKVEVLVNDTKDVSAEYEAQVTSLEQDLKDLEALTQT
jgi:uncharacterized protein YgiM (DUF1202 family)